MARSIPRSPGSLRLVLLGTPRLELPRGATHLLERRGAALLTLLALQGATPRARAAATIWPEVDEHHASNSLRQRIYKLNQAAGRELVVADRALAIAEDILHDLRPPSQQLQADPNSCLDTLLGDLDFSDCGELDRWVMTARQRWRDELARALATLASRHEAEGRIAAALQMALRLVEIEPTQEHAHRRVMRLHYLRGDRAAALESFDRCRLILREELGILPDTETQALEQLITRAEVQAPRATPPPPVTMLRPPELIGREAEWTQLQQAGEHQRTVLLLGDPGIGKSRLLADYATAKRGVAVRARPGDAGVPYAAIARLLRALLAAGALPDDSSARVLARILPELGRPVRGPLDLLQLRSSISSCIRAAVAAGIQVAALDDAQFADAASLEQLPTLASADNGQPTMSMQWVIACRTGEMPAPLSAWRDIQDSDALTVLVLGALDETAVRALLESLGVPNMDAGHWAPALLRHTGGNPMFILETLRALLEQRRPLDDPGAAALPVPSDVGAMIERRLGQLSPEALNLAQVAALAGQDFSPELAAQVLARRVIDLAEPWRELEQAQVIRDRGFAHDLIVEALLRTLPRAIAGALHGAIARVLQQTGAPAARIAEHWAAAEDYPAAHTAFIAAADRARAVSRLDEELQLLVRADECLRQVAMDAQRPAVLMRALVAAFELGQFARMRTFATSLEQVASTPGDRLLALEARLRVQAQDLDFAGMLRTADEALPLAEQLGNAFQRAFVHELKANALARLDRGKEAMQSLAICSDWARCNPDHPWASGALVDIAATLSYLERYAESGVAAERAYHAAERAGHVRHMHMASANVAMIRYVTGDIGGSAEEYERCRALAIRFGGDSLGSWSQGASMSRSLRLLGRYDQALSHAQQQIDACLRADSGAGEWWHVIAELELVHCWFELGQLGRARRGLGHHPPVHDDARFRWILTRCRIEGASAQQLRAWLDEAAMLARGGLRTRGKHWSLAIEQWSVLPVEEAIELLQGHAQTCIEANAWVYFWPLRMRLLQALLNANRTDEAATSADELRTISRQRIPAGPYLPEYHWTLFKAFAAAGNHATATEALQDAVTWIGAALPHVPEPFRDSFLHRNPVNRAVLTHPLGPPLQ